MPKIIKPREMWFEWPEDPFGGRILVRHLKAGDTAGIHSQCMSAVNSYDAELNTVEVTQRHDLAKERQLTCQAAVVDWENFMGEDGKPMKCDKAGKQAFAMEDGFFSQLQAFRGQLSDLVDKEEEEAIKNLSALPSGSPA
ncbi:MAG: hypothetical protein OEV73_00485 [Desulfobulbaceae bacterium]|nr:hypothetical protein [Desulfobulbaceae bacterium]